MGSVTISRRHLLSGVLRLGRLAVVSYMVGMATWTLLGPTPFAGLPVAADREAALIRDAARLTVSVDGLVTGARAATVAEALGSLGLAAHPGDRLSSEPAARARVGQRIALDRGIPATLVDGGRIVMTRSPHGTVADLLAAVSVVLGPLDRIDRSLGAVIAAGDVIRITRITDHELTLYEDVAWPVRHVPDANLDRGSRLVVTAGVPGQAANTYLVRVVDGEEESRTLIASVEVVAPVEEIRRVGTRAPRVPAEIEAIIREAAALHGADPDQLLRVAWCESRFNPSAYNASGASGLFQFMPRTWAANSVRAGYAGASPFDPVAASNVAAWMFARGSASLWSCK